MDALLWQACGNVSGERAVMTEWMERTLPADTTVRTLGTRPPTWQENMLPLMRRTVIGLTVFFFLASCLQLLYLNQRLFDAPNANVRDALSPLSLGVHSSSEEILAATRLKAIVTLEASALDLQYHQAGVLLMSRLWTTYLGFVTGMIFALVGAMFVLGKLESDPSELKTKVGTALDTSFKSASPGLVLAVLGVIAYIQKNPALMAQNPAFRAEVLQAYQYSVDRSD
jgi:hypothetical protein